MKKLIFLFSLMISTLAFGQDEVPYEFLGTWYNNQGETLQIKRDLDKVVFVRSTNSNIIIKAKGTISMSTEGNLHIVREDANDEYRLGYGISGTTLVITQPRSTQAWLWTKINNNQ